MLRITLAFHDGMQIFVQIRIFSLNDQSDILILFPTELDFRECVSKACIMQIASFLFSSHKTLAQNI